MILNGAGCLYIYIYNIGLYDIKWCRLFIYIYIYIYIYIGLCDIKWCRLFIYI